jgi:hypothetical protein
MPAKASEKVSKGLHDEIEYSVKYGYPLDVDYLANRESMKVQDRKSKRAFIRKYSAKVARKFKPYPGDRCPECGVKLAVRRCLACDLKKMK